MQTMQTMMKRRTKRRRRRRRRRTMTTESQNVCASSVGRCLDASRQNGDETTRER
jgi:hypothetical protein